jgi:hypothetical protein
MYAVGFDKTEACGDLMSESKTSSKRKRRKQELVVKVPFLQPDNCATPVSS